MKRLNLIKLFYSVASVLSIVNGVWMFLLPLSWYNDFPADIPHTGPFNPHFVRDLGVAFLVVALAFAWMARNMERARPVHFALTLFFVGHALIHLVDILSGRLPGSHWLVDLPGVFVPALIMIALAFNPITRRLSKNRS